MLLAIDIGNTNIVLAVMNEERVLHSWRIATNPIRTKDEYIIIITSLLDNNNVEKKAIQSVIISSVVPNMQSSFVDISQDVFNKIPIIVTPDIQTGLSIQLDNPKEIGADLIATAVGARNVYTDADLIVIDCGTATKLTVVTNEGNFLGGIIAPGLEISAKSLTAATAALPQVALKFPKSILGTNTVDAIASGQMYGYIGLIKELVERLKNHYPDKHFKVVATGGYMHILHEKLEIIDYFDENLIFRGLYVLNQLNE